MLRLVLLIVALSACSSRDKYAVSNYYDPKEQDEMLTSIVTFLLDAPPYTKMSDRFAPEHRAYYRKAASRFKLDQYYVDDSGVHYFYVVRPAPEPGKGRGVGGHFRLSGKDTLISFKEEFVTPIMPVADITGKCKFLFDEMVKGTLEPYLEMTTYIQWPNPISVYDTTTYEWKLKAN